MSKGTIIYVGGFYLPDKNASANRVVNNGKLFSSLGFNVVYLGTDYNNCSISSFAQLDNFPNMYAESRPSSSVQWFKRMFSVKNISGLVDLYKDTCAIILYNVPYSLVLSVRRFLKDKDIKLFYDCTEWTKDTDGNIIKKVIKSADEYFIRNFLADAVDGLIVISKLMRDSYSGKCPVLLLPPLVDIEDAIWHQEPFDYSDTFDFCFSGVPESKDHLENVIKAFCALGEENISLHVVGVSKEEYVSLNPDCENYLINKNVIFTGYVSHELSVKYILSCNCFIFLRPSNRRNNAGFPTKFAEAYTTGSYIIASDISDLSGYITDNNSGSLLSSDCVNDVSRHLKYAIESVSDSKTLTDKFNFISYYASCNNWLNEVGFES